MRAEPQGGHGLEVVNPSGPDAPAVRSLRSCSRSGLRLVTLRMFLPAPRVVRPAGISPRTASVIAVFLPRPSIRTNGRTCVRPCARPGLDGKGSMRFLPAILIFGAAGAGYVYTHDDVAKTFSPA